MKRKYISAKEIIDKYKISYSLLNYYTNMGLFKVEKRNGNMRLYDEKEIKNKRTKISGLINAGYPLRIICKMLNAKF